MLTVALSFFLMSVSVAHCATTVTKRADPSDVEILNYALTLEHLENAFYRDGLARFNNNDFKQAGFDKWVRGRFTEIAEHEAAHVAFLETALGAQAVKPCEYSFPYNDVRSFTSLSMVLEGVGVSAYLGAAKFIDNPDYLTAAGAILTTESRHAAWVSSAVRKQAAWSGSLDVPLSLNQVYSLAAPFFKSCPAGNPQLPVRAFPTLTVKTTNYSSGSTIQLAFDEAVANGQNVFLALYTGLSTEIVPIQRKSATLPGGLEGTIYAVVTTSDQMPNDENTVAGPAILYFPVLS